MSRSDALSWWRSLDESEQRSIAQRYYSDYSFEEITTSSSRIEFMYYQEINK